MKQSITFMRWALVCLRRAGKGVIRRPLQLNPAQSASQHSRHLWRSSILAALLFLLTAALVFAVHNLGFALGDGETPGSATIQAPDGQLLDWAGLFDTSGNLKDTSLKASFIRDELSAKGTRDGTTFINSAKNTDLISAWRWDGGKVPAKDDLSNVYLYSSENVLYVGVERIDGSGDSHVDFELNQQEIQRNEDGTFSGFRTKNDMLVLLDYDRGGKLLSVEIRTWSGNQWSEPIRTLVGEGCLGEDLCAFNNNVKIPGGDWPSYDRQGRPTDTLEPNAFTELGININDLLGESPDFCTVQFKSRTSTSFDSELKDLAGPEKIGDCEPPLTLSIEPAAAANQVSQDHTFAIKANKSGVEVKVSLENDLGASASFAGGSDSITCVTDQSCEQLTISNTATGLTWIKATADETSAEAVKRWVDARLTLEQEAAGNRVGMSHTVTATLKFDKGDGSGFNTTSAGEKITFAFGAGSAGSFVNDSTCMTDANGQCAVEITSSTTGPTEVKAEWSGTINTGEGDAAASTSSEPLTTTWIDASLSLNPAFAVNVPSLGQTEHIITATLSLDDGSGSPILTGKPINFEVTGSSAGDYQCTTDSNGECSVTLDFDELGTSTITASWPGPYVTASGDEIMIMVSDEAEKRWIEIELVVEPLEAASRIGEDHFITATLKYSDGLTIEPVAAYTGTISFGLFLNSPGELDPEECTSKLSASCTTRLTSDETGLSIVTVKFNGDVKLGNGLVIKNITNKEVQAIHQWVDARLGVTPQKLLASVQVSPTITATLEFDYGDGDSFKPPVTAQTITFTKFISEPGTFVGGVDNGDGTESVTCITGVDGTCTVTLASTGEPGQATIVVSWGGEIIIGEVVAFLQEEADLDLRWLDVRLACEDEFEPNISVADILDPAAPPEKHQLETPFAQRSSRLCNDEDVDFWWLDLELAESSIITVTLTTGDQADYDVAVFTALDELDPDNPAEDEQVLLTTMDTTAVNSAGRMSSGRMSSGRMSSGRMSSGRMSSGSFQPSTADEQAIAHVEGGQKVFIAVLSTAGDFGPEYTMTVETKETDIGQCAWTPPETGYTPSIDFAPANVGSDTLILTNLERLSAIYAQDAQSEQKLQDFLDRLNDLAGAVNGTVVTVEADPGVGAAYDAWNLDYCSVRAGNAVADAIKGLIDTQYSGADYIVIAGSSEIIPARQVLEGPIAISPETDYVGPSGTNNDNPLYWALSGGRFATDDFYADDQPQLYLGQKLYLADRPIGRLVETPEDMMAVIDNFLDPVTGGEVGAQTCLVTAYEFLLDSGQAINDILSLPELEGGFALTGTALVNDQWTAADLGNAWELGPDILSVNGHFEHWRMLPAAGAQLFYSSDVPDTNANVIGYSVGCHAGLSMPDDWIDPGLPDPAVKNIRDDFPSVLAGQGAAAWFANSGFGYGDDEAITDSELLMLYYSQELGLDTPGGVTVGEAMRRAKDRYLNSFAAGSLGIYEAKSMMEATLYGLPMHRVSVPAPQSIAALFPQVGPSEDVTRLASPIVDGVLVTSQEEPQTLTVDLSARTINLAIPTVPALTENVTPRGRFFSAGGKDAVQVYPGRPLEPRFETSIDTTAHGAVLMSATFEDIANFDPVITNPATDTTRLEATLSENGWFPPTDGVWVVNRFGTDRQLVVVPGQYNPAGRVQRKYTDMTVEVYTSDNDADYQPPGIWNPRTTCQGDEVTFSVKVDDPGGIMKVFVTYLLPGTSVWQTQQLVSLGNHPDDDGSFLAQDSFTLGENVEYFIQAVDSAGNVNTDTNKGRHYRTCRSNSNASNNFENKKQHTVNIVLEFNDGEGWQPLANAMVADGFVKLDGVGSLTNYCSLIGTDPNGACDLVISADGLGFSTLTFSPTFTVSFLSDLPGFEGETVIAPVRFEDRLPQPYVKEWWNGSISIFKNVTGGEQDDAICMTLTGGLIGAEGSKQCKSLMHSGKNTLLFNWPNLATADNYMIEETFAANGLAPLHKIDNISLDVANRDVLVRTVNNSRPKGCSPGYWKVEQHWDSWEGYTPGPPPEGAGDIVSDVFALPAEVADTMVKLDGSGNDSTAQVSIGEATLGQALRFNGSGPAGLLRAGVAALLNASNSDVPYPYSTNDVIFAVNDALQAGEPQIGELAGELDRLNNIGCPLN